MNKRFETEILEKSIIQKGNLLKSCFDDELFKSWSGDLQKRFPNAQWKTINGARVLVNGGKVVAGLDGFNGEIDKFFEGKGKKESGKSGDKKEVKSNIPKEFAHELENYKKATGDKKAAMRKTLLDNANIKDEGLTETQKEIKQRSIDILKESGESRKEPQEEHESEGKLSEREQGLLDAYNKDKKAFLKQNTESAMFNPKAALENIDNWLSGSTTKEYKDMILDVKKSIEEKIAEPKNTMNSFKEAEEKLKRFVGEKEGEVDLDKFLQGDVVENFKEYKAYETAANKAEKAGNAVMRGEMIQIPLIEGREVKLPKKDIKVMVSKTTEDALYGGVSKDKFDSEFRKQFTGIYNDPDGYKVATDANAIIAVKTDVGENYGKILNPKTGEEIEAKFPNWKQVIPERFDGEKKFKLSDIHSTSKQASEIRKQNPISHMKIDGLPQAFNPEIVNNTVETLRKLGVEDVTIGYSENISRGIVIKGETKDGEKVTGLIMPMMQENESKVHFKQK
jgi:hypothetical protein